MQGDDATAEATPRPDRNKPETVAQCHKLIAQQAAHHSRLQQIASLEERLKLDWRNSSKPPSLDGPGHGKRVERPLSGHRRGGPKGHPGAFRVLLREGEVPRVVECPPTALCQGGNTMQADAEAVRHRAFDVQTVRTRVDEYRLHVGRCISCGRARRWRLPAGVSNGQLGLRALAFIGVYRARETNNER